MKIKSRLDLACVCKICKLKFICWDNWLPKEVDSGTFISAFTCPNCHQDGLDFDVFQAENKIE